MIKFLDFKNIFSVDDLNNSSFRNDISFLRVIAVFAVIFYHFNIFPARSGFAGVDIFFVISGFLMTKIILGGFDKNSFSLLSFYNRRLVRIFPALLVLLLILLFSVYFFVPTQFINYLRSAFSSSLFFSNVHYFQNTGYFSADSHNNFLLHTWSLSVEWQFYMIYPIILLGLKKVYSNNIKLFYILFTALIIVSFSAMMIHNLKDYSYSFYIFYTRAWEMLFGGLSLFAAAQLNRITKNLKIILAIFSYFILGICLVFLASENWPSLLTLIPVFFTALIIGLNVNFNFFNNGKIKYLGDISYSLYLYHWPVYVFSKFYGANTGYLHILVLLLISVIFAALSYKFVEKKSSDRHTKLILAATCVIFLGTFFLSFSDAKKYLKKDGNLTNVTADYKNDTAPNQFNFKNGHFLGENDFKDYDLSLIKIDHTRKNVVLLGDSHAGMFSQTFKNILAERNINFIQITADGTYPMVNSKGFYKGPVDYFNYIFKDFFPKNYKDIDLVVITSNYAAYSHDEVDEMVNFTNNYFKNKKVKFLYLGQTKNYPIEFPTYVYMKNRYGIKYREEDKLFKKSHSINQFLIKKLSDRYINLLDYKIAETSLDNYPYIYDMNHLTFYGTELYKQLIEKKLDSSL